MSRTTYQFRCRCRSRTLTDVADYVAHGGWSIEAIRLDGRDCYRVTRRGYIVGAGYCYSLAELERVLAAHGLGFGDLTEDDPECELPLRRQRQRRRPLGGSAERTHRICAGVNRAVTSG